MNLPKKMSSPKILVLNVFSQLIVERVGHLMLCSVALCALGACTLQTTAVAQTESAAANSAQTQTPVTTESAVATPPDTQSESAFDLQREDIRSFINDVAARHQLEPQAIEALLAEGRYQPRIIEAISRPAERVLSWWEYRDRLVSNQRVQMGREFWQEHRALLLDVEARSGVDAHYIAAIIGIETNYGRNKGSWRVLDALMTLGFDYPPRSRFFRSELEQFLLLANEEGLDPKATRGSYAGAMGAPQFMPSSYRRFAVDQDLKPTIGSRDLFNDWADVMASIANYFLAHGWQPGAPVLAEATAPVGTMATLERGNLRLNTTLGALADQGVQVAPWTSVETQSDTPLDLPRETPAILLPAELADAEQVRVGFNNFHVITRYNRSILYAMAVHDLARAIKEGVD